MKTSVLRLESLSDDELLARLGDVVRRTRRVEAELVWHLAEVDRRKLYAREACSSMHVYATSRLHLSDAEAYLRITVARVSRKFPVVLSMLADGRIHLTAVAMLAPHLRETDGEALLARAVHRSKREIEELVAEIAPRPDAPSRVRRLPQPRSRSAPASGTPAGAAGADGFRLDGVCDREVVNRPAPVQAPGVRMQPDAVVIPTSPSRYRVQFTAGEELHGKIRRAQAMLRHQIPDGNLAAVFDRAITLLVQELERTRFAATAAPRTSADEIDPTPVSRHIPDAVKREVWKRDGEQCTFHDRQGRRCAARAWLEFHHITPFARGGEHSASNVTLRCSTHNACQADLDFGVEVMDAYRRRDDGPGSPARSPRVRYGGGATSWPDWSWMSSDAPWSERARRTGDVRLSCRWLMGLGTNRRGNAAVAAGVGGP